MGRAKRPKRLPTVLSKEEVARVPTAISGTYGLMAKIIYGCGLRLMECARLRVSKGSKGMGMAIPFPL
jgi:integrase